MTADTFTSNALVGREQQPVIIAMAHSLATGNTLDHTIHEIESSTIVTLDTETYTLGMDLVENVNDVLKSVDAQVPSEHQIGEYQITPAMSTAIAIMHTTAAFVMHNEVKQATNNAQLFQRLLLLSIICNILMVVSAWVN